MIKVNFRKLNDNAVMPHRGSSSAAGYDFVAAESALIEPGESKLVGTGLAIEVPEGYFGAIFARSGLAAKQGLRPANCVGVCDSDYRGEYKVAVYNDSKKIQLIEKGSRIAQLVIMPYLPVEFVEVDKLCDTDRGEGGFGSTGVK